MATTCKLIAKTTLGSDTASVTMGSGGTIPQTYTDLLLVVSGRTNRASNVADGSRIRINGDTGNNYSYLFLQSDGSSVISGSDTGQAQAIGPIFPATSATADTFGNFEFYFPNYTGSTNKSFSSTGVHETNGSTAYIHANACLWSSTAAITSLTVFAANGSLVSGTSVYLFGITKA